MRIIAGRFRSRRLRSPNGEGIRPTPDRLRESLFSVLAPQIEGCIFIDAYAGTGAVGLEALSRGAKHVILVERSPAAISVLKDNIRNLEVEKEVTVLRGSASRLVAQQAGDVLFVDPPYNQTEEYAAVLAAARATVVIAQHDRRFEMSDAYGPLARVRTLRQGDNVLSFFRATAIHVL